MLITKLVLKDFKSYHDATVVFTPGANAIIGENGAGKSSILEAIGYALFDARPPGFKLSTLVREGQRSGSVVVDMVSPADKRPYVVERRFSTTTTSLYRIMDPELDSRVIADGAEDVRQWLQEHLKLDEGQSASDLFTNTIGVPQGTLTAPFLQTASARKAIFDPLLRVQEYGRASVQLRSAQRQLDDQAQQLAERLARIEGELVQQDALQDESDALARQIEQDGALLSKLVAELAQAQARLDALDVLQVALRQAEQALAQAEHTRSLQAERVTSNQRALAQADQARALIAQAEAGHLAYLESERALDTLESSRQERDRLLEHRRAAQTTLAQIGERLTQIEQQFAAIATAEAEITRLTPLAAQQAALEGQLRAAEQARARLRDAQPQQQRLEQELAQRHQELADLEQQFAQAASVTADITALEQTLAEGQEQLARAREEGAGTQAEMRRLQQQTHTLEQTSAARCPVCEAELTPAHRAEMIARNQTALTALEEALATSQRATTEHQSAIKAIETKLTSARRAMRNLPQERDLAQARQRLEQAQSLAQEAAASVDNLLERTQGLDDLARSLQELGHPQARLAVQQSVVARRDELAQQRHDSSAQAADTERVLGQIDASLVPLSNLEVQMASLRAERETHRADHEAYLANRESAERWAALHDQAQVLATSLAEAQAALDSGQTALNDAQAAYDAQAHAQAREIHAAAREQQVAAQTRLAASQTRQRQVVAQLAHLTELGQERVAVHERQAQTDAQRSALNYVRRLLRQAGPHITRQLVQRISAQASTLFGDIMENHRGRLLWSEDYELTIEMGGHERAFRQLSGGEQMSAALALRMALLKETSELKLAFFDEPTAHLDAERRDGLAEKIVQVQGFDQVFVISHDDTFERVAQNFLRIVKDEGGSHPEEL